MKIIFKILNTITALALVPVLLFMPMFRFIMTIGLSANNQLLSLIGSLFDVQSVIKTATGIDFEKLPEFYTIPELYDLVFSKNSAFSTAGIDFSALPEDALKLFSAAGVLFAAALVFAVILIITGLFTKKHLLTSFFGLSGFLCTFAANKCFSSVAERIVSGNISLVPVIEKMEALSNYSNYLKYIDIDIRILELGSAYTLLLVIFGAIVFMNVIFYLVQAVSDK